jgi:hypothetical protein
LASAAPSTRYLPLAALFAGYVLTVAVFFRPVHLRVWNILGLVDILVMAVLILPFLIVARPARPQRRATRWAWGVCAVMAIDFLCFAVGELGLDGGGHPSLGSLISYGLALAKTILVPLALVLLAAAGIAGERLAIIAAGLACVAAETLYATYPTGWWGGV